MYSWAMWTLCPLWPLNKRTNINPGLRKSFHLLLFRYVWMLCWWIPHQEKPGKHPDEVATTLKKSNSLKFFEAHMHFSLLQADQTKPPQTKDWSNMWHRRLHTIQLNQGHQPASHPNQIRPKIYHQPNETRPEVKKHLIHRRTIKPYHGNSWCFTKA